MSVVKQTIKFWAKAFPCEHSHKLTGGVVLRL